MQSVETSESFREIMSQPETWSELLASYASRRETLRPAAQAWRGSRWLITGCGTTYALGLTLASLCRQLGMAAACVPASEVAFYPEMLPFQPDVMLAISRSGSSSETLWAAEAFRKAAPGGALVCVTTQPGSALAAQADLVLDASPAQEKAVPETRSFTGMLLLARAFLGDVAGEESRLPALNALPAILETKLAGYVDLAKSIADDRAISRLFFLGGGPLYGLACEGMFKIKEYMGGWAEAYHPLEFRHGPRASADRGALLVALLSDRAAEHELRLLREMKQQGASTVAVCGAHQAVEAGAIDHIVALPGELSELDRGLVGMPLIQLIGLWQAGKAGCDPDRPALLKASTKL